MSERSQRARRRAAERDAREERRRRAAERDEREERRRRAAERDEREEERRAQIQRINVLPPPLEPHRLNLLSVPPLVDNRRYNADEPVPHRLVPPYISQAVLVDNRRNNADEPMLPVLRFPQPLKTINLETVAVEKIPEEVFDPVMQESMTLQEYLDDDKDNIVFIYDKFAFGWTKSDLKKSKIENRKFYYECKKENLGGVVPLDLIYDIPYIKIEDASGDYFVNADQLHSVIESTARMFVLKEILDLKFTTGIDNVMVSPYGATNFRGELINIVSAHHCQAGTDRTLFHIFIAQT